MLHLAEAASGIDALVQNLGWTLGVLAVGLVVGFVAGVLKSKKVIKALKDANAGEA